MKKPNYDYDRVAMIESLFLDFELCKDSKKKAELRYKILDLTKQLRFDLAKRDLNKTKRERFRLAKLECENESTATT